MSTLTAKPLSLVRIHFQELYQRHLRRHSQLGVNVVHLVALIGVWFSVYSALFALTGSPYVPAGLAVAYFSVLVVNTPLRVLIAVGMLLMLLVGAVVAIPTLPAWAFWVSLLPIPILYKLQAWSHRVWNVERDLSEFNVKYQKGFILFVVLLFYEVPIVLNYLVFDRRRWA
jgi:hypothetical protein